MFLYLAINWNTPARSSKDDIKPGFSKSVLEALKVKFNAMDCRDKNVVLVFDEMSIKDASCTMLEEMLFRDLKILAILAKQGILQTML